MSEQTQGQEGQQQNTETKAPELSPIEQKAIELGWRPKEEFDGSEDDFIDAKEFVRRQPLFDKIEHTTKELKNLKRAFSQLSDHYSKVQETEYNRALKELKTLRKEAITNGDGDTFDQLDTEIKKVESQMEQVKKTVPQVDEVPEAPKEFVDWTRRNKWYNETSYMRAWADELGTRLAKEGKSPSEVLKVVEKEVQKEFPHKFRNPNKDSAPDMESGSKTSKGGKVDSFKLTDDEERTLKTFIRTIPGFTREKYIADLKKVKGVE